MTTTNLGPYIVGEVPEPVQYTWLNDTGQPYDLTGFTAYIKWRVGPGDTIRRDATLPAPATGVWEYVWTDVDIVAPGTVKGEFWVTNGTNTYAQPFSMLVRPAQAP